MYLRTTARRNQDGTVVRYSQLAENVWDPQKRCAVAKVIYSFGRVQDAEVEKLRRLAHSILRVFPDEASLRAEDDIHIRESRPYGGVYVLEALWREYRARGLVVLGVSEDRGAPRALIEPYVKNLGLTFPILLDPDVATGEAWRVTGLPATYLVRPGGEVAGVAVGAREWNSAPMRALIETMLPGHGPHGR
jgi:hypothetical protein